MSIKRMSRKLKEGLTRNLSKISFKGNADSDGIDTFFGNSKYNSKGAWHVLITGGAGHLAENLVDKLVEHMKDDIRLHVMEEFDNEDERGNLGFELMSGKRMKKHQKWLKIQQEVENRLNSHIQIVLVDVIPPKPSMRNNYTTFIQGSFLDEEAMKTALENVDTVYHLAAVGMTGKGARERKACMDLNAVGTTNLLSWSKNAGVQRFIYTSSVGVIFKGEPLHNAKESLDYPDDFYNFYCESKAHAETIVRQASSEEMKTTVLRFNGIYGPGEKRVTERVVEFMLSGWWIGICKPNGVEATTQLSSVANCVQGLVKAENALRPADANHGQVYNIMDPTPVGTFSFWAPLNSALGFSNHMYHIPPFFLRQLGSWSQYISDKWKTEPLVSKLEIDLLLIETTFSLDKARREIGYEPYPDQMPEIVEYYKNKIISGEFKTQRQNSVQLTVAVLIFFAIFLISLCLVSLSWCSLCLLHMCLSFVGL